MGGKAIRLIILLLLFAAHCSAGNGRLVGTVISTEDGAAIPFANIMVYNQPDSTLLGFAISSAEGAFAVSIPSPTGLLTIKVSCIGFKNQVITAQADADSLVIRLEPDNKMLETVVVKGRAPGIKVSGDTIDYNISKYAVGNEKVLKDILAKLPGMDVNEKGQVTVNGETVKKILIDGQDFFGNQNEQITNNLPADIVDGVQLRKNYSEYSLLSGFNTRKTNALNVVTDSMRHGRLTGNAELQGGWPSSYRGVMNAFSFGGKAMFGFNAKYFNTGEEIMTLIDYVKLMGSINDYANSFGGQDRTIEKNTSLNSFLTNNINTYSRRNGLISSNLAWNPNEHLKLNAYYLFNSEVSKGKYDIERTYLQTNKTEELDERQDARRYFHHFGLNMKYAMPDGVALDSRTTITAMPQTIDKHVGSYDTNDELREWDISHRMAFLKNWNNRNLLSVIGELGYHHQHRDFRVESSGRLYDLPEDLCCVGQTQKRYQLDALLTVSWSHRLSKVWQMDMAGGWNIIRNGLSADATSGNFNMSRQSLTNNVYDYSVLFSKKKGLLRMNSGLKIANFRNRNERDKIVLLPDVRLEMAFSSTNSISLSYGSSYETDDAMFAKGTMIDDYRQYTLYSGEQDILHRKDRLQLSAKYFDIISDFTFIANVGCSFKDNPYIANYQSNSHGVTVSYKQADSNSLTQYAYINVKKGLRVPLVLTLKSTLTNSLFQTAYQNMLSDNRLSQMDGSLAVTTKFKSLFNVEMGYKLALQQSKTGISNRIVNYAVHEMYAKPMLLRKNKFELTLPLSFAIDNSGQDSFRNFDLGLSAIVYYGRWSFSLEGRNMLHTRNYRRLRIDSLGEYDEAIIENRLPGYLIAGAKYMF